ncbi:MAG TPA: hypothetical protein VFK30_06430 [Anaerolineae bacterium]|nr:hypothetical protein [Anaerolineae bacterium]
MRTRLSSLLFLIILAAVAWFVLDRVRIVLFIQTSPITLLIFIVVAAVIIYLLIDHILHRSR